MQSVFTGPELLSRWCNLGTGPVFELVINRTFALWLSEKVGTSDSQFKFGLYTLLLTSLPKVRNLTDEKL